MENNPLKYNWYAIRVKSRSEKKVLFDLVELQIEAYLPIQRKLRQWSDRKKWVETPLISGYVFVYISRKEYEAVLRIYNGKDLNGWERLKGTAEYTVVHGEIVGTTQLNTSNTFLTTPLTFADFLLEYEIKMDEGLNSGVLIQSESNKEYNDGRVLGCQVICDDSPRA